MGKAAKRRERAKRVAQYYKTTGCSPPDRATKRYFTYFFIRDGHVRNKRERGSFLDRFDTIQVCIFVVPYFVSLLDIEKIQVYRSRIIWPYLS